jgi:hypothetical protein
LHIRFLRVSSVGNVDPTRQNWLPGAHGVLSDESELHDCKLKTAAK